MTAKHLPGPWFVSRDPRPDMEWNLHIASVASPNLEVCSMFHTLDQDDNEQGEANARLVAAAPEMLEALRDTRAWVDNIGDDTDWKYDRLDYLDAVIAKAIGS